MYLRLTVGNLCEGFSHQCMWAGHFFLLARPRLRLFPNFLRERVSGWKDTVTVVGTGIATYLGGIGGGIRLLLRAWKLDAVLAQHPNPLGNESLLRQLRQVGSEDWLTLQLGDAIIEGDHERGTHSIDPTASPYQGQSRAMMQLQMPEFLPACCARLGAYPTYCLQCAYSHLCR